MSCVGRLQIGRRLRCLMGWVCAGRKPKLTDHQRREAIKRRDRGETTADIARSYNVHHSTISRLTSLM